jgi:hypothetical protein
MHTGFWWGTLRERDLLEYIGVDLKIIVKLIFKKYNGEVDWIDLAQDTDKWAAVVNALMNLLFP